LTEPAVEVCDVWFWYGDGRPVLRGANLGVSRGEFVALVGSNGSGKTTLVKHINGLIRPRRGQVRLYGEDTQRRSVGELARQVGYLFQHPEHQIFCATVREEVAFGPQNQGLAPPELEARVEAALERFDLSTVAAQPPAILSYGLRRRVTLASLAAMEPAVVVLDEPTVGLDARGRDETFQWLSDLHARGRTILLVSHDMSVVARYADRVVVLREGQVAADGSPATLFQQPELLARASLARPPVASLAQRLKPFGMSGDSVTVEAFCDEYTRRLASRAKSTPDHRLSHARPLPSPPGAQEYHRPASPGIPLPPPAEETSPLPGLPPVQPGRSNGQADPMGANLYLARDSWLHRMDPRAKLWAVLLAGIAGLMFRNIAMLAGLLIATQVLLLSARIPLERLRWFWARIAPLLVMILILQPLFSPGPGPDLIQLGPLRLTVAGLLDGMSFALRAAALAFVAAILLLTTEPTQLVRGLVKLGLPYAWGLTVALAIRYLPTTYRLYVTVSEAQQARGWIVGQGSFVARARSYLPIMVATIISALRQSDFLGLALAARGLGFPRRRTTLYDVHFLPGDWLTVTMTSVIFASLVLLRFVVGFGGAPW
jgi:energy-coupling factor transport system ATP-binding protein